MRGWAQIRAWMPGMVLVTLVVCLAGPATVRAEQTQLPAAEWDALVALYEATDGPNWTTPWDLTTETPCSSLPGVDCVGCSYGDCHVDTLRLDSFGLSGELPAELANLSALTTLTLRENVLTGTISTAVTGLVNLEALDLGENDLTGALPPELADLSDLRHIQLFGNALSGEIPPEWGMLTNLSHLDLARNELTGEIPAELGNLTNLWTLNLGGNQLVGEIPPELGNLTHLRFLYLFDNQLTGEIPAELANLSELYTLSLGGNDLTGPIPAWLGDFDQLSLIALDGNHLSGPIPPELGNLSNLYWLELANNQLVGPIPPELANVTRIANPASGATVVLDLGYNMLWAESDALDAFLAQNPYWQHTQVVPPADLQAIPLGGGVQLTWSPPLHMGYQGYLEVGISAMAGGPYTTALRIDDYEATGAKISGLPPETTYYLAARMYGPAGGMQINDLLSPWSNEMTITTLPGQSQLPDAEYAALEALYAAAGGAGWTVGWSLPTSVPCNAGVLPGVTCADGHVVRLSLPNVGLSGAIPPELGALDMLESLDLRNNALSGAIPSELGGLSSLRYLILDGNQLSGPIPPELGNLDALRRLSLGNNRLSGPIPPALGNLNNLYWLALNNNGLVGPIPPELADLSGITMLDLSYNALWAEGDALANLLAADPDWTETQGAPPGDLHVTPVASGARLAWTPIAYRTPGSYYEVGYSTRAGGPYSALLRTASAAATGAMLTSVLPHTTGYLAVRTYIPPTPERPFDLLSSYGQEVILARASLPVVGR